MGHLRVSLVTLALSVRDGMAGLFNVKAWTMGMPEHNNQLRTPVLITAFARYDTTVRIFDAVRAARPTRLYFGCDGPRNADEKVLTDRVRSLVDVVDWPCEVRTLFRDENVGLQRAMVGNLDWFFGEEERGIVLEDDTAPLPSFFRFCEELLERYQDEPRVWWILGNNLKARPSAAPRASYYFSQHGYGAPWGWAGWRRSWKLYDVRMSQWPQVRNTPEWDAFFLSRSEKAEADHIFEATWDGRIKTTWAFQNDFARILHGARTIIPEFNLVKNIGFTGDGTNTVQGFDPRDVDNLSEMPFPLVHPPDLSVDKERDLAYFNEFIRPPLFRRVRTTVKGFIPERIDTAITPFVSRLLKRLGGN